MCGLRDARRGEAAARSAMAPSAFTLSAVAGRDPPCVALALLGAVHRLRKYLSESELVVDLCSTYHEQVAVTMAEMHNQYGSGNHATATEPADRHMMSRWLLRLFGEHRPVSLVHFNEYTVWHRGDPRRLVVRVLYRGESLRSGRYCFRDRRTR